MSMGARLISVMKVGGQNETLREERGRVIEPAKIQRVRIEESCGGLALGGYEAYRHLQVLGTEPDGPKESDATLQGQPIKTIPSDHSI